VGLGFKGNEGGTGGGDTVRRVVLVLLDSPAFPLGK
jgi:hypothetical protein